MLASHGLGVGGGGCWNGACIEAAEYTTYIGLATQTGSFIFARNTLWDQTNYWTNLVSFLTVLLVNDHVLPPLILRYRCHVSFTVSFSILSECDLVNLLFCTQCGYTSKQLLEHMLMEDAHMQTYIAHTHTHTHTHTHAHTHTLQWFCKVLLAICNVFISHYVPK